MLPELLEKRNKVEHSLLGLAEHTIAKTQNK
jgi:hypothetical protein